MSQRDPIDVLHAVMLQADGGVAGVAKAIGRSPQVLYNKLSDTMPHYEVSAREALAIAEHLRTTAYAEAVADYFGGVFFSAPQAAAADDDVLQSYMDIIRQMGKLSDELTEARADGVIEPAEFQALQLRGRRTMAAVARMLAELEALVRDLPGDAPAFSPRVVGRG